MPPSRYRREARVQHALRLMAETQAPLAAVAAQAGFADQSHLGRAVRAATGRTPDQLRRQLAA
jgi:AraC family transcriptional regulator